MTNSLSEQVAELEAERDGLSEKVTLLWDMSERIRTERDRLKADAMSDLTQRHWLETQVRNREAERDELTRKNTLASWKIENLKFELDKVSGERNDLRDERDDLQGQVQEARDERDEAQTEVERLTESLDDWRRFGREHVARANRFHAENANLRAKAEALRAGQGRRPGEIIAFDCCSPRPTGYADDDHQDAEVLQWHQPTPRLTVHDLEVAPVGSVLSFGHLERTKGPYGLWIAGTGATFSNKGMIERGFEDATLTTPEAQ